MSSNERPNHDLEIFNSNKEIKNDNEKDVITNDKQQHQIIDATKEGDCCDEELHELVNDKYFEEIFVDDVGDNTNNLNQQPAPSPAPSTNLFDQMFFNHKTNLSMNNSTSDVEHKKEDDSSFVKSFRNFSQSFHHKVWGDTKWAQSFHNKVWGQNENADVKSESNENKK